MGEYAFFVWSCYGAVVVILSVLGLLSWKSKQDDENELKSLQQKFDQLNK